MPPKTKKQQQKSGRMSKQAMDEDSSSFTENPASARKTWDDSEEESEEEQVNPKAGGKKKQVESSDEESSEEESEDEKPKKKAPAKKAASKKKQAESSEEESSEEESSEEESSEDEKPKKKSPAKKAPAKKAAKKKVESSDEESSEEESSEEESSEDERPKKKAPAKKAPAKKAPAKKAKKVESESEEESEEESDDEKPKKAQPKAKVQAKPKQQQQQKKPLAASFQALNLSDEEEEQDDEEQDKEEVSKPQPVKGKAAQKGKGGKTDKQEKKNENLDDILSEFNDVDKAKKAAKKKAQAEKKAAAKEAEEKAKAEAAAAGLPVPEETGEKKLTAAQKKRLKKKEKEAAAPKEEKKDEKKPEEKKKAKPSALGLALKEAMAKKAEEDRLAREAEEKRLAEEAAEAQRKKEEAEAAERARLAEIQRKKEAKEAAEREAKAKGTFLTPAQKAAQAKARQKLAAMLKSGMVVPPAVLAKLQADAGEGPAAPAAEAADSEDKNKDKKGKFDRHKKGKQQHSRQDAAKAEAERIRKAAEEANRLKEAEEKAKADALAAEKQAEEDRRRLEALLAEEESEVSEEQLSPDEEEEEEDEVEEEPEDSWESSVPDSWDADSDDEREKEAEKERKKQSKEQHRKQRIAEKEARRQARQAAKEAKHAEKQALRKKLIEQEEERQRAAAEARKKAEEDAKKAAEAEAKKKAEEEAKRKAEDADKKKDASGTAVAKKEKKPAKVEESKDLRSPICCVLGHVDTGKTKILDKIRQSNVQDREAGGITQQIGATYVPMENIREKTAVLNKTLKKPLEYKLPGLLIIDTPGHESFTNLRTRGSGLCDIAVLVVDIMHGLEPQTLESINLLKMRQTPFVVALNKCDRMYGWKAQPNAPWLTTLASQTDDAQREFKDRASKTILAFAEQGLNTALYYENKDMRSYISLVPTSAITGEGLPDLMMLLVQLTQNRMAARLETQNKLQCTVLEVKPVEGHGTTLDVILVNGVLHQNDTIVVCGLQGPIVTSIRALLTPPPMSELRVKSQYVHHPMVKAAMGVKIAANGLEHAVAGSQLLVCGPKDDIEDLKDEVQSDLATILSKIDKSGKGVCVQASTLGSLEALLAFLKDMKIPVSGIGLGNVHKKDVMRAAIMLEHKVEYATILAFDVKITPEIHRMAEEMNVKIFSAEIIYHLFDQWTKYMEQIKKERRDAASGQAVFPCILEVLPDHVYRNKDPIICGVRVIDGVIKLGTPLCVPSKDFIDIGRVTSIEDNRVEVKEAKKGMEVAIKIERDLNGPHIYYGRHFDEKNHLVSKLSRESIDLLKENFRDDMTDEWWRLVIHLKSVFAIQ